VHESIHGGLITHTNGLLASRHCTKKFGHTADGQGCQWPPTVFEDIEPRKDRAKKGHKSQDYNDFEQRNHGHTTLDEEKKAKRQWQRNNENERRHNKNEQRNNDKVQRKN